MRTSSADSPHIDHATLRELMQPSLFQWSVRVFGDWMVIVIPMAILALTHHWAAWVFAVIMTGIGQHRVALMAHEGSHRQASRNKLLNDFLVGMFTLWPFGNPVGGYRRFHFDHHRYLNTEGDPELAHKRKSAPAWDLPADWRRALKYFLLDVCFVNIKELLHLSQNARPGSSKLDRLFPGLWYLGAVAVIGYFHAWWIFGVWFLATAIVFWPIFRLRIWTEHVGTHDVHRIHAPWWLRFVLLPHNTWYHYEHHHFPQVPCWNLPKVRALVGDSPEIFPLGYVLGYYRRAPAIPSGAPTRKLKEKLPKFDPRRVAEIPTEWEDGRLSGVGAGTGGDAVYHTEDDIREHAPHFRPTEERPLEESVAS